MQQLIRSISLASVCLCACTDVSARFNLENEVANITVDFAGPCEGTDTRTNDFGTSTWTKTSTEGGCEVVVAWDGQLVPIETFRQRIEDEAGDVVKEITVDRLSITVRSVQLRDSGGITKMPAITAFDGRADVGANNLYMIDRNDVDNLLNVTGTIERTLEAPHPILDALNASMNDGASLSARADLTIIVPAATLATLQVESENPHRITVAHDFGVEATATIGL